MSKFILFLGLFLAGLAHATTALEAAMSDEEKSASGLNKLSEAEKTYLSNWLLARESLQPSTQDLTLTEGVISTQIRLSVLSDHDAFGLEQLEPPTVQMMKGRLRGDFDGWDGDTKFRLDNGQIWQQRAGGEYDTAKRTQPEVIIEKSRFGYYLKIVETGRTVGVRRIK